TSYRDIRDLHSFPTRRSSDLLILNRRGFGTSNYQDRKLLVFIELIEMLELAIASPIDYEKTDKLFSQHTEQMFAFQKLIFEMSRSEEHTSELQSRENLVCRLL